MITEIDPRVTLAYPNVSSVAKYSVFSQLNSRLDDLPTVPLSPKHSLNSLRNVTALSHRDSDSDTGYVVSSRGPNRAPVIKQAVHVYAAPPSEKRAPVSLIESLTELSNFKRFGDTASVASSASVGRVAHPQNHVPFDVVSQASSTSSLKSSLKNTTVVKLVDPASQQSSPRKVVTFEAAPASDDGIEPPSKRLIFEPTNRPNAERMREKAEKKLVFKQLRVLRDPRLKAYDIPTKIGGRKVFRKLDRLTSSLHSEVVTAAAAC